MGMYTEIFANADLKPETPQHVLDVLRAICEQDDSSPCLKGYPYSWVCLFSNGSYYTPLTQCSTLSYDEIAGRYSIIGKGDIKNYNREIESFFEFIKPWCEPGFIGYHRYEEFREPTLVFTEEQGDE